MSATDLAPPYGKYHIKTWKRSMSKKKGHQKFWEIDEHFLGEMQKFFDKRLKKVVQKFRQKCGPPVSEVLDPLVCLSDVKMRKAEHPTRYTKLSSSLTLPRSLLTTLLKLPSRTVPR